VSALYPGEDGAVHMFFGGSPTRPSRRHEQLIRREVFNTDSVKPSYLKWSEVPITFDRKDQPDHVSQPGSYPLVVAPLFKSKRIHKVLMDGGSGINVLYASTLDDMGIPRSKLWSSTALFQGSSLEWRHPPSGRSICPHVRGPAKLSHENPHLRSGWRRTTPSSGGRHTQSLWSCPTTCNWNWRFPARRESTQ
jgi:hypothetical protein